MSKPTSHAKKKSWLRADRSRIASGIDRILLYEFDLLEEHRDFVARHFTKTLSGLNKKFNDAVSEVTDPENPLAYDDHLADEYQKLARDLPRLQWYAQFLVAYSTFENTLNELCRIVERRSNQRLSFKDLGGLGITRASNYLRKVAGVETPFKTLHWNKVQLLGDIRNAIVHRNGEIDYDIENKKGLAHRVRNIADLKLRQAFEGAEDAEIILGPEFVRDAIASLRRVLADVANYKLYPDES